MKVGEKALWPSSTCSTPYLLHSIVQSLHIDPFLIPLTTAQDLLFQDQDHDYRVQDQDPDRVNWVSRCEACLSGLTDLKPSRIVSQVSCLLSPVVCSESTVTGRSF